MSPVLLHCGLRRGSLSLLTEGSLLFCPCEPSVPPWGIKGLRQKALVHSDGYHQSDINMTIDCVLLIEIAHIQLH